MPVPLKDVKGLMVKAKQVRFVTRKMKASFLTSDIGITEENISYNINAENYNQAVKEQGHRKIGLNRETLAEIVYNDLREGFFKSFHRIIKDYPDWANADNSWRTTAYRMADAIIARESEILEWKP